MDKDLKGTVIAGLMIWVGSVIVSAWVGLLCAIGYNIFRWLT